MDYNDQWVLRQIKRHEEIISLLVSRLGAVVSIIQQGSTDYILELGTPADLPETPPNLPDGSSGVGKTWLAVFLDNSPMMRWSVQNQNWQ